MSCSAAKQKISDYVDDEGAELEAELDAETERQAGPDDEDGEE